MQEDGNGADLHYANFQQLNPPQAGPPAVSHSCLFILKFKIIHVRWDICLFVYFQMHSEDTVTYSNIMVLSGGEDQDSSRSAGTIVDPSALYATVQKDNRTRS